MTFLVVGINHKTASVDLRGKLAVADAKLAEALQAFCHQTGASEALMLSTCNRVEIYSIGTTSNDVITWLCAHHDLNHNELSPFLYIHQGINAVEHAMKVAASMDSMIIGEPQILGQMKQAFTTAQQVGCISTKLHRIFQQVFSAAKEIRSETSIGQCPVSVALSAVQLAKQRLNDLNQAKVAIIGAGSTASLLVKHLRNFKLQRLMVFNRSLDKAQALLAGHGEAHPLSDLSQHLAEVDLILTATSSETPIITPELMQPALYHRSEPLLIVDLSSPRNVSAEVGELPQVQLCCIDDLQTLIQHHSLRRAQAALAANNIIQAHLTKYLQSLEALSAVNTICAVRAKTKSLCEEELEKSLKQLALGEDPNQVLKQFAHSLTNKWLHQPSLQLHQAGVEGSQETLLIAQRLFALSSEN